MLDRLRFYFAYRGKKRRTEHMMRPITMTVLNSIRWFDGITEIVPCDERELGEVVDQASSYVIIDPVNAVVLLDYINKHFHLNCETTRLSICDIFYWDGDKFVKLTNLIKQLCLVHNSINTVCEHYTGSQKTAIVSFT